MANNSAFAVTAVIICIVAPILGGFMWPTDTEITTAWQTNGNMMDLTASLATEQIPGTLDYSGANNNLYSFNYTTIEDANGPNGVSYTTDVTSYPAYAQSPVGYTSINMDMVGTHLLNDLILSRDYQSMITGISNSSTYSGVDTTGLMIGYNEISDGTNDQSFELADGTEFYALRYTANGVLYGYIKEGYAYLDGAMMQLSPSEVIVTTTAGLKSEAYKAYQPGGVIHYIDAGAGFWARSEIWSNGYINHSIDIILDLKSAYNTSNEAVYSIFAASFYVKLDTNGNIYLAGHDCDYSALGTVTAYPYVLLRVDADNDTATLYGLIGYSTPFNTPTQAQLGNSIQADAFYDLKPFRSMHLQALGNPYLYYFVSSTYSELYYFSGMTDSSVAPVNYYPDDEWLLQIYQPAVFGDSITIAGTSSHTYTISGGKITVPLLIDGESTDTTIEVRNMKIAHYYDNGTAVTLINGEVYAAENDVIRVTFGGDWVSSVYLFDVESYAKTGYVWEAGGFGIDMTGFCAIGIIAAGSCFVLFGLMYRRDGEWSTIFGMVTSVIIAAIYIMILMTD